MYIWFLLLILYIPFQIALNPASNFDLASLRVFIVLLFLVWLAKNIKNFCKGIYFKNLQGIALILFFVSILFSLIGAENVSWGVRKIVFFVSIFPLYFLTLALVSGWVKTKKLFVVLVVGGVSFALIGLGQFFSVFVFGLEEVYGFWARNIVPIFSGFNFGALILAYPSWLVNVGGKTIMRAFSFFSDPHMFSFYLGMILPLMVVLPLRSRFRWLVLRCRNSYVAHTIFVVVFVALLLSFTRGAYVAVIVSFLLVSALIWMFLERKKLPIFLCLLLLVFIIPSTPISDRFYSSFDFNEGSNIGRLEMWRQSGQAGLGSFWNGVGLGNYSLAVNPDFGYRNPVTAHNLYLDIFSEVGFLGLFFWLFLLFGTIWQLFRKLRETKIREQKYVIIGLIGSFSYFLVHSFFETPIYSPSVLALLMVILGLSSVVMQLKK